MRNFPTITMTFMALCSVAFANVAITEFQSNSEGEDSGREWIEVFNYGAVAIDLTGWTLADEDSDVFNIPAGTIIAPGGYLVFVTPGSGPDMTPAQAKAVFEAEWLGGTPDNRVIGMTAFANGNSSDELRLIDDNSNVVWNLAYTNDENDNATWLTVDDFSLTNWGSKIGPFIDRSGDDLGTPGLLGYEANISPVDGPLDPADDPLAWESEFEAVKNATFLSSIQLPIDFYDNVDNGSWGSPLAGIYTPEPATLAFVTLGGLALVRRR